LGDICDIFELQLLVKLDLELRFQVVGAEVELYVGVLIADNLLFLVDYGVCEAGVERVIEDVLVFAIAVCAV
jgi:hypothetical protein